MCVDEKMSTGFQELTKMRKDTNTIKYANNDIKNMSQCFLLNECCWINKLVEIGVSFRSNSIIPLINLKTNKFESLHC